MPVKYRWVNGHFDYELSINDTDEMENFSNKQSFMCFQNVLFNLLFDNKNYAYFVGTSLWFWTMHEVMLL